MVHDQFFFALVNPIVCLLISLVFGALWLRWPHYRHLPTLSLAFLSLCLAFVVYELQLLVWPSEVNIGANVLYVVAVTLACSSTLLRKSISPPSALFGAAIALGAMPFAWFLFIEPSLQGRIIATSGIFAAVTGITLWRLLQQTDRSFADNLFAAGVALAFAIAILRPVLVVVGLLAIDSPGGFAMSDYWISIRAFTPLMAFVVATLFAAGITFDIVSHLQGQADRDYLTGLLNRRGFETAGAEALARDLAGSRQSAMIVADIDDFKKVNDTYGHKVGDAVIAGVAKVLSLHGRAKLAARIGGEEYALYYADMSRAALTELARTIRGELENLHIPGLPDGYSITLSMGIHVAYSQEGLIDMMARADQALYRAKREGKDKAVLTPIQLRLAPQNAHA
ncbi:GGDEF domain-containing protein [Devosia soli]|uniref:GGDEF domain-containing protein n=1 Tax=Devosia soli TaxID=361041 RepID=UPI00069BD603|nr:diguanylate cyclase [Devosia soli]